ncbi:MAG: hypothetical protein WBQ66_05010, partial [Blastocatellia bacterium]
VWSRDGYAQPVSLRARVIVADHWRRSANYDPVADALRTTNTSGVAGTYRPGGGYYGLVVVEGPTPSAFFEAGTRPGYIRTMLPRDWFDYRTKTQFEAPLRESVSVTVHLAGIGDFPITASSRSEPAFQYNFNPMASAPLTWDLEPNNPLPGNPTYGADWRVTAWTSFHVNLSGEYEGSAQGGIIEGDGDPGSSSDPFFPRGPLLWTNPATGQTLEARATQTARGGRVRTATVYTGEGQRTDFTNAAGVITPALETWALGPNPLQRIGSNTTAKMFIFSVDSAVEFRRLGSPAIVSTIAIPPLTVSSTQIPSGQTASGGIIRPPTHLAVRAAAVAAIPKAVYRIAKPDAGNDK